MSSKSRLPAAVAESVFTESPLRSTLPKRVALVSAEPAATVEPSVPTVPSPAEAVVQAPPQQARMPAPPAIGAAVGPPSVAASPTVGQNQKLTGYVTQEQMDALEDEVYLRRKRGSRIGISDVLREALDVWLASKRAPPTA